jgi:hypothetical protein
MGVLPAAGQWIRLEIPASSIGMEGRTLAGIWTNAFSGQVWFDRIGKNGTP